MKFNPIALVISVLAIVVVAYYLHHHMINVDVNIKGDKGQKSHMGLKIDEPKLDKLEIEHL